MERMSQSNQCLGCARYRGLLECAAFPDGIPQEILDGTFDHSKSYEGDGGLQFVATVDAATDEKFAYPES